MVNCRVDPVLGGDLSQGATSAFSHLPFSPATYNPPDKTRVSVFKPDIYKPTAEDIESIYSYLTFGVNIPCEEAIVARYIRDYPAC